MLKRLNDKGFGVTEFLTILVVIIVVVGGGLYIYHKDHKKMPATTTSTSVNKSTRTVATQQYMNITQWGGKSSII